MKHAELLHDSASLERGEELSELFIDSFTSYRLSLGIPESKIYEGERLQYIADYFIEQATKSEPTEEDYANFGRTMLQAIQARKQKEELQKAAYEPVLTFLSLHHGAPIAVSDRIPKQRPRAIWGVGPGGRPHKRKRGGFVIPSIPTVARLGVALHNDATEPSFEVQIFNSRDKTARIAIGEQ